jgi:hypothetical protein
MARLDIDVPAGGTTGDWYLVFVRSEGGASSTPAVYLDDAGFSVLGAPDGAENNWVFLWGRPYDGAEPSTWHAEAVENYGQYAAFLIRGAAATTPFVFGAVDFTAGSADDNPTHTITAVTTTVAQSFVLVGYDSYWPYAFGADSDISPAPDTVLVSADATTPMRVNYVEVATAGTVGPWTVNRSGVEYGTNPFGVVSWTVTVKPTAADPMPTIEAQTVGFAEPYAGSPSTQPPEAVIVNPYNSDQVAVIGGATQAEQDSLIDAQEAAWAAAAQATTDTDDAATAFTTNVAGDIADNAAFIASPGSSDPQLVAITEQMQRVLAALATLINP